MATVTKLVSGQTTTYTVTDATGVQGTIATTVGPTSGNTTTIAATGLHNDGLMMMVNLLGQLQIGILPGSGAQGLLP